MGYYINPPDCSKEAFLRAHGTPLTEAEVRKFNFAISALPVCLVDNGGFTAVGILYDERERDAWLHPDPRPKKWYSVSRDHLKQYLET